MSSEPASGAALAALCTLEVACFGEKAWSAAMIEGELRREGGVRVLIPGEGFALGWSLCGEAELLRMGVVPAQKGYKPSQMDVMEFQELLQLELQKMGY